MRGARIVLAAAALALGGCSLKTVDPCAGQTATCVGLQLDPSTAITKLDTATIHVVGGGIDAEHTATLGKGGSFSLPAAVALVLKSLAGKSVPVSIIVNGSLGGRIVSTGKTNTTVSAAQHLTVHVTMNAGATVSEPGDMAMPGGGPDMATCKPGFHLCNGTCADDTSIETCGTSCTACPVGANATGATCDGTSCGLACNNGFHVCNGMCVDGTSAGSCNMSCTPCTAPMGGTATCDGTQCGGSCPANQKLCAGACIPSGMACNNTCPAGTHDCNGNCFSDGSVNSCGTSCTPCPVPTFATMSICTANGTCDFQCDSSHKKCGSLCIPLSGCCGDADCAQPNNGSASCNLSTHMCVVTCNAPSYTNCSNMCLPINNVNSCGPSCLTCTQAPSGGTPSCDGTQCTFTCNDHYVKSGNSCVACGTETKTCCAGNTCDSPLVCTTGTCQQHYLTWTEQASVAGVTAPLYGVWVNSNGGVYAVGGGQSIVYSATGTASWSKQTSPVTTGDLRGIWGRGNGAFAVGPAGELISTGGSTWNKFGCSIGADTNDLLGINGDATHLYMWDSASSIAIYNSSTLMCSSLTTSNKLNIITGVWFSGTNIYAVGEAPGFMVEPAIAHSIDSGTTWKLDMQPVITGSNQMSAIWGTASGKLYATGGNGYIFTNTVGGTTWTAEDTTEVGGAVLYAFWGSDQSGYVYAVGAGGTIVHTSGNGVWHHETSNTTANLWAVWGNAAGTAVFAAGDNGTIVSGQ